MDLQYKPGLKLFQFLIMGNSQHGQLDYIRGGSLNSRIDSLALGLGRGMAVGGKNSRKPAPAPGHGCNMAVGPCAIQNLVVIGAQALQS